MTDRHKQAQIQRQVEAVWLRPWQRHLAKPSMRAGIGVLSLGTVRSIIGFVPEMFRGKQEYNRIPTSSHCKATGETKVGEDKGPSWALKAWKGDRKPLQCLPFLKFCRKENAPGNTAGMFSTPSVPQTPCVHPARTSCPVWCLSRESGVKEKGLVGSVCLLACPE